LGTPSHLSRALQQGNDGFFADVFAVSLSLTSAAMFGLLGQMWLAKSG
jgi:hypothetical protein